MTNRIRATLLGACLLLYMATALGSTSARSTPAAAAPLDPELLGMVVRDPWYDFGTYPGFPDEPNKVAQERMGALLAEAGVRWVRLEFFVEGDDAAALERSFARYDYFINEVAPRHGLKVLGLVSFGLIRGVDPLDLKGGIAAGPFTTDPSYGGGVNPYIKTWLDRALGIANHYGGAVAAYEVLNEQNRLPPNGDAVPASIAARLHTKFYRLLKFPKVPDGAAWRTSVEVIVGGLHPKGTLEKGKPGYMSDAEYLRQLYGYKAGLPVSGEPFTDYLKSYGSYPLDGLGYHPYPEEIRLSLQADAELIDGRLTTIRSVLKDDVADPDRRYWITEIGYNAGFKKQDEVGQAAFLKAVYTSMAARDDVAHIFWFKYEDFPPASGPNAQRWGVVKIPFTIDSACEGGACYAETGDPNALRPSFFAYRELAGLPNSQLHTPLVMR